MLNDYFQTMTPKLRVGEGGREGWMGEEGWSGEEGGMGEGV